MAKIFVGCAGFDYKDWNGPFYPKSLERHLHLDYYTKFFEIVEINATFYNLPSQDAVHKWHDDVPEKFNYIIKVWQDITHKLFDENLESKLYQFFDRLAPLNGKILAYLFQFPPWLKFTEKHYNRIKSLINEIANAGKIILEFRDNSWFLPEILSNLIDGRKTILGTSYLEGINPYYFPSQNTYYIRLIGDRQLSRFNRVQRHLDDLMIDMEQNIEKLLKDPNVFEIFIIINNHFSGFAPETANNIKEKLGLPLKAFSKQKSLTDFF
ncbi:MAG: DUF72 domain-containing protein [Promethearchaeota archaeon]|nr:MAG: DUF72 domain-containing protein [Candidatus Lokiarchaeota archaeon]